MTKKEILDYIMFTPENTNRQVLSYMLDDIGSGSGGEGNIPLPEYECDFVNGTEDNNIIINLDLADITEDDALVTVHFEGEEESSNLYLILDLNTHTGIAVAANGIVGLVADFYTIENNTFCDMEIWPPEPPQPTESYNTWKYATNKQYEAYSYQYQGETINGFITNSAYPALSTNHDMELLSFVNIQSDDEDHPDFMLAAQIDGVIVDNNFMPIENFYTNWNTNNINKTTPYRYVFSFDGIPTYTTGVVMLTWYGAESGSQK